MAFRAAVGDPALSSLTSSGTAVRKASASGAPGLQPFEVDAELHGQSNASGTPSLQAYESTASARVRLEHTASGTPSLQAFTSDASGRSASSLADGAASLSAFTSTATASIITDQLSVSATLDPFTISAVVGLTELPDAGASVDLEPYTVDGSISLKGPASRYQTYEELRDGRLAGAKTLAAGPGNYTYVGCLDKVVVVETGNAAYMTIAGEMAVDGQVCLIRPAFIGDNFAAVGSILAVTTQTEEGGYLYLLEYTLSPNVVKKIALHPDADPNAMDVDWDLGLVIVPGRNGTIVAYEAFEVEVGRKVFDLNFAGRRIARIENLQRIDVSRGTTGYTKSEGSFPNGSGRAVREEGHIFLLFDERGALVSQVNLRRMWERREELFK